MKYLKKILDGFFILINLPLLLLYQVLILLPTDKNATFAAFSQFYSLLPGKTGNYIRANFYRFCMAECDPRVVISFASLFSQQNTRICEGVYIGPQCNIGSCSIGKDALLGSGVHILSGKSQHNFTELDKPMREQGGRFEKISIGEDTWIGNNSVVMADIGKKCIIGSGAVVTQAIPDYSIAVGNPAKVVKTRQ